MNRVSFAGLACAVFVFGAGSGCAPRGTAEDAGFVRDGGTGAPEDPDAGADSGVTDSGVSDGGLSDGGFVDDGGHDAGSNDPLPSVAFVPIAEPAIDEQGRSQPFEALLGDDTSAFALRVTAPPGTNAEVCFQLEQVVTEAGEEWVPAADTSEQWGPYCRGCSQRVHVQPGFGLFVFPNNGAPLDATSSLTARISLRHCSTLVPASASLLELPSHVRVELAHWTAPAPGVEAPLTVRFAFAGDGVFPDGLSDPLLAAAVQRAELILSQAGLAVGWSEDRVAAPDDRVVRYGPSDRLALDRLFSSAASSIQGPARPLVVVVVPCLRFENTWLGTTREPEAFAARLPAGSSPEGRADAVFVASEDCAVPGSDRWVSGDALGRVLAHEVAHALGLSHTVESDGREDHLTDTTPDAPNLMHYTGGAGEDLSASQRSALRMSPYFALSP